MAGLATALPKMRGGEGLLRLKARSGQAFALLAPPETDRILVPRRRYDGQAVVDSGSTRRQWQGGRLVVMGYSCPGMPLGAVPAAKAGIGHSLGSKRKGATSGSTGYVMQMEMATLVSIGCGCGE